MPDNIETVIDTDELSPGILVRDSLVREQLLIGIKKELDVIRRALREDEEYYYGWQANIAMSFVDEYLKVFAADDILKDDLYGVANAAAKNFLDRLIKE